MRGATPLEPRARVAFLAGLLAGWLPLTVLLAALVVAIGPAVFVAKLERAWRIATGRSVPLELPPAVFEDLRAVGGVVENGPGPSRSRPHDTPLVEPDAALGWRLRPGARVTGFQVRALDPLNFNPPIIYLRSGQRQPPALKAFLDEQTRLRFEYTIDERGCRRTVPKVEASRRLLMVGDSVLFGVGVDDEETIASRLQQLVKDEVTNAAVGGYNGDQLPKRARQLLERGRYDQLVYIACQNDFMVAGGGTYVEQAGRVLNEFVPLVRSQRLPLLVVLQTTMEYTARDVLLDAGAGAWTSSMIDQSDALRRELPKLTRDRGFDFLDLTDMVKAASVDEGTLFARFALYVDHVHFSPEGNRRAAILVSSRLNDSPK